MMRATPNMTVLDLGEAVEVGQAVALAARIAGPFICGSGGGCCRCCSTAAVTGLSLDRVTASPRQGYRIHRVGLDGPSGRWRSRAAGAIRNRSGVVHASEHQTA